MSGPVYFNVKFIFKKKKLKFLQYYATNAAVKNLKHSFKHISWLIPVNYITRAP